MSHSFLVVLSKALALQHSSLKPHPAGCPSSVSVNCVCFQTRTAWADIHSLTERADRQCNITPEDVLQFKHHLDELLDQLTWHAGAQGFDETKRLQSLDIYAGDYNHFPDTVEDMFTRHIRRSSEHNFHSVWRCHLHMASAVHQWPKSALFFPAITYRSAALLGWTWLT